ncbi:SUMF1/EgtB/PvdO family nonheme iron enzyme [Streptomyces sp. NPDC056697]|uniref:SUMF1/EgtB/PvdO family nonheme iron enzyme n=1 Tax=Streptomyces sp. NPDC056697 TaxID=3345915 RepID=UPI0036A80F17
MYARWAGKALPTSRQWEKAARSPKGRDYPWGNEPTAAKCNAAETGIDATTPVSRYELKGSAWTSPFERAAPSPQNAADSTMKDNDIGFRCISCSDVFCAAPPAIVEGWRAAVLERRVYPGLVPAEDGGASSSHGPATALIEYG